MCSSSPTTSLLRDRRHGARLVHLPKTNSTATSPSSASRFPCPAASTASPLPFPARTLTQPRRRERGLPWRRRRADPARLSLFDATLAITFPPSHAFRAWTRHLRGTRRKLHVNGSAAAQRDGRLRAFRAGSLMLLALSRHFHARQRLAHGDVMPNSILSPRPARAATTAQIAVTGRAVSRRSRSAQDPA